MEGTITCKTCTKSISNSDNFCPNCGESTDLIGSRSNAGQLLVFLSVIFLFSTAFIWFIVDTIIFFTGSYDFYEFTDIISYFTRLIIMSLGLLLAFSLKSGTKKTLAIIFASIYTLIELYWYIKNLIPEEPVDFFQF